MSKQPFYVGDRVVAIDNSYPKLLYKYSIGAIETVKEILPTGMGGKNEWLFKSEKSGDCYLNCSHFVPIERTRINYVVKEVELDMSALRRIRQRLPIKWDLFGEHPLVILLTHSDSDGEIAWQDCKPIADELTKLLDKLPEEPAGGHIGNWKDKTQTFINGLMSAFDKKENLDFH